MAVAAPAAKLAPMASLLPRSSSLALPLYRTSVRNDVGVSPKAESAERL